MANKKLTRGLVLGKFYPPHRGHQYLLNFAQCSVDELTVVVEKRAEETIPVTLRRQWLKEIVPKAQVLVLEDDNPQHPHETPDFWPIWQASLLRLLPAGVDYVFASEPYGEPLAACLEAAFIPVDLERQRYPISGTEVRVNPYRHWSQLTPSVKRYFRRRICIAGPESTGKTTLAKFLVNTLNQEMPGLAALVPEYARTYLEARDVDIDQATMYTIAKGQAIAESLLLADDNSPPLHIVDTGVLASRVWSEFLLGTSSSALNCLCEKSHYDLYLLCAPDVPWVAEAVRYLPDKGEAFYERLKSLCTESGPVDIVVISGDWDHRNSVALNACRALIDALLSSS